MLDGVFNNGEQVTMGMSQELPPEAIEILRQARATGRKLEESGAGELFQEVKDLGNVNEESNENAPAKMDPIESPETSGLRTPRSNLPKQEYAAPVQSYETFFEINGLPSGGSLYPDRLTGQSMKVEDLLLIQSINKWNVNQRFSEIFARRIRGINPENILSMDESYIAAWLRAQTYKNHEFPYIGDIQCSNPDCSHTETDYTVELPFNSLKFESTIPIEKIMNLYFETGYIEHTLPSGETVRLHIRQRKHDISVERFLYRNYESQGKEIPEGLDILARSIVAFEYPGKNFNLEQKIEKFKNSPAEDYSDLLNFVLENTPSSEQYFEYKCPECGEVTRVSYPFPEDFYFPGTKT